MDKNVLLSDEVQTFIREHENDDLSTLLLQRDRYPNLPLAEIADQIRSRKKAKNKLPKWYATNYILYPKPVSIEQSSSAASADWKANYIGFGESGIDLTGGFGVDSHFFAKNFNKWLHIEPNYELQDIVQHNAAKLGISNIKFVNQTAEVYINTIRKKVDLIYVDPDRRPDTDRVTAFKDSTPDLTSMLPRLQQLAKRVLIKASPMIDISSGIAELGGVTRVVVLSIGNEVKEVLFDINNSQIDRPSIRCVNIGNSGIDSFDYSPKNKFQEVIETGVISSYLYEPNASIMKSGGQDAIGSSLYLVKLNRNTNLFTSSDFVENFPGRVFKVVGNVPYKRKAIIPYLPDHKANLSTRNFVDTPKQMKKKLGTKDGGSTYLFGYRDHHNKNKVAICSKLHDHTYAGSHNN